MTVLCFFPRLTDTTKALPQAQKCKIFNLEEHSHTPSAISSSSLSPCLATWLLICACQKAAAEASDSGSQAPAADCAYLLHRSWLFSPKSQSAERPPCLASAVQTSHLTAQQPFNCSHTHERERDRSYTTSPSQARCLHLLELSSTPKMKRVESLPPSSCTAVTGTLAVVR